MPMKKEGNFLTKKRSFKSGYNDSTSLEDMIVKRQKRAQ